MYLSHKIFLTATIVTFFFTISNALKDGECEVCIKTIDNFVTTISDDVKKDPKQVEAAFKKFCKVSKGKEHRLVTRFILMYSFC